MISKSFSSRYRISIHAPTRGATLFPSRGSSVCFYFNPRSHEGSDKFIGLKATLETLFQSTLPRGERPGSESGKQSNDSNFNPRSHEGSDTNAPSAVDVNSNFNPRSHEGSDSACPCYHHSTLISIHAPTRGATLR